MGAISSVFQTLLDLFWTKKLDIVVIGLENSGKTTLLSVLANGEPVETGKTLIYLPSQSIRKLFSF